jgi:3-hydroxyisobutyrate dehydrogenase
MKIGFVGLGAMGRGMARNLVRAGFPTAVFDVRPDVVRELESDGARSAADAAEVAVGAGLVCIAVFDDRQVRQVLAGDGSGPGVLSAASPGTIVALHTTTAPDFVVEMAELAAHRHVAVLDAAMTGGGVAAADAGELTFMVGGENETLQRVRPAFDAMAQTIFHLGPLGAGMSAKIVSNFLSAGNVALVREAIRIATAAGFGEKQVLEVVNAGKVGASWVSNNWDRIRRREVSHPPGTEGPAQVWLKDMTLAGALSRSHDVAAPVLECLLSDVAPTVRAEGLTG